MPETESATKEGSIETECGHNLQSAEGGGGSGEVRKGDLLIHERETVWPRGSGARLNDCVRVGEWGR